MDDRLAARFEDARPHLRAVAYRMLGSLAEADDAVQESWLRVSRGATADVRNWVGWLTTVLARVCLDMLRARRARPEDPVGTQVPEPESDADPEQEAVLADSVGLALLVVLDALGPAERLAFVLHDMFAVPFDEIAPILGRSATATRQLASRARRRVRGAPGPTDLPADVDRRRAVVEAFLAASREGDFDALVALLHPDVMVEADLGRGRRTVRGAGSVAEQALLFTARSRFARPAMVDGAVGIVVAPRGRLAVAMTFTVTDGRIARIRILGDPAHLADLTITVPG
jgi:RNA polymerase sigma factor (sigma-70 family)